MARTFFTVAVSIALCVLLSACSGAEKSAAMVLDNAGSVVREGNDKIWINPDATPTPKR